MTVQVLHGDCLEVLRGLDDCSVDAVVCDPPYGLSNTKPAQVADVLKAWVTGDTEAVPTTKGGFMGAAWDGFVPPPAVWEECMRVLKPGGHMAVFAGARTQDLMGLSIRLAGFEIRDTLGWITGSGFPKSMDIGKAIDKRRDEDLEPQARVAKWLVDRMAEKGMTRKNISDHFNAANVAQQWTTYWTDGAVKPRVPKWDQWQELKRLLEFSDELDAEVWRLNGRKGTPGEAWGKREVVGAGTSGKTYGMGGLRGVETSTGSFDLTAPASDAAKQWDGWGTALKPAIEPIILARKPLVGTVAANVLAHGVGGLNIDACRVSGEGLKASDYDDTRRTSPKYSGILNGGKEGEYRGGAGEVPAGRFPANVLLDEHAAQEMDKQSGWSKSPDVGSVASTKPRHSGSMVGAFKHPEPMLNGHGDSGGASRFFPVFKYQAKAPKKERPVIYKSNCECEEWQSRQKDTTGSTVTEERSWNTSTSGNSTTEKCQQDTTYTTSTTTSSTTGLRTSNASAGSIIRESTQDAKSEMANGGNRAESVESSNQSEQSTGISAERGGHSMDDAGHAISEKWYTTSNCEKCGEPRLKVQHATVKPLALMEWLVSLIVPPGGVVLDPFAGSGTTLQAALNKGFIPIGIEQDADYIKLIEKRLEVGSSTHNS